MSLCASAAFSFYQQNTSVLENHHWKSAVGLLRETRLFSHLPAEDRSASVLIFQRFCWFCRETANETYVKSFPFSLNMERELGSLILATDISRQNDYLSRFRMHLDKENLCLSNASHRHFVLQVCLLLVFCRLGPGALLFLILLLFSNTAQMALKCADICNPCRPWELSKQWSERVTEEFFQQGYLSV